MREGSVHVDGKTDPPVTEAGYIQREDNQGLPVGTILAALSAATDQSPIMIGKPQPTLMEQAIRRMGATPETTAAIGDRPETDILSAQRAGLLSILALSGATDRARLATFDIQPDLIVQDIQALVQGWARVINTRTQAI